jgi:hypothetical protein
VTFPAITGTSLTVTITATDDAFTIDRRYAEPVRLPAAISEITGVGVIAATLPATIDTGCRTDTLSVDGSGVGIRFSGTVADLFADRPATVTLCDDSATKLASGEHLVRSTSGAGTGIDIDRVVLSSPAAGASETTSSGTGSSTRVTVLRQDHTSRTVRVDACPTGCWFVFGEGYNTGGRATSGGRSLGAQQQVDGGFNGWYLPPSDQARTIVLEFQGQRTLVIGVALSALGVLVCIALIVLDRRRIAVEDADEPRPARVWGRPTRGSPYRWTSAATLSTASATIVGALVIAPLWGVLCGALAFVACFVLRRPRLLGWASLVIVAGMAAVMVRRVTSLHPFANAGWPGRFEDLHRPGMAVIVLLFASAIATIRPAPPDEVTP